jgi:DNA-binding NtrC family response regulator
LHAISSLRRFATTDVPVLIQGETGTGKELAARALHFLSGRRELPFVPVNCGALPDTLLESELFGHERGAFTDARDSREGLVTVAGAGTLFLDEIEALSPRAQVVLLRFLQDHSYRSVGGRRQQISPARVVAACNVDLEGLVLQDRFRIDLRYRLSALTVTLPPLRDRREDIAPLAQVFLDRLCAAHHHEPLVIGPAARGRLLDYRWPGNVRELEGQVLREFLMSEDGQLQFEKLAATPSKQADGVRAIEPGHDFIRAKADAIRRFELSFLDALLTRSAGNMSEAARLANQDRGSLNRLIRKHGIKPDSYRIRAAFE